MRGIEPPSPESQPDALPLSYIHHGTIIGSHSTDRTCDFPLIGRVLFRLSYAAWVEVRGRPAGSVQIGLVNPPANDLAVGVSQRDGRHTARCCCMHDRVTRFGRRQLEGRRSPLSRGDDAAHVAFLMLSCASGAPGPNRTVDPRGRSSLLWSAELPGRMLHDWKRGRDSNSRGEETRRTCKPMPSTAWLPRWRNMPRTWSEPRELDPPEQLGRLPPHRSARPA